MQDQSGFGGGPIYVILWSIGGLIDLIAICDWFTLFYDTHMIILCLIANICFPWNKSDHHLGTFFCLSYSFSYFVSGDIHLVSMLD